MMLAPYVSLTGTLSFLDDGFRGTMQTVRTMRALVNQYRTNMDVRRAASSILFLTPERNTLSRARAIFEWVRDYVRYVPDVFEVETLMTPDKTLAGLVGDCDDQSTLLAAMFEAVGYPTRFVVAAYQDAAQFEHVYVQVYVDGQWLDADATEPHPLGWAPPDPLTVWTE